jgi:hypothetical protein
LITQTILCEDYRSLSSALCSFLHSLVNSSLWRSIALLSTLFWNSLSLHFSLNVRDQVSRAYKITEKNYNFVYLNLNFFNKLEDKTFCTEW